ncbi:cysteine--tRNA ligase [Arthrobacter sp. CAN_A1]|uniref:cysteine--tRNA ligase n=1 Tax=Arthrobacter sp. CAN_A1 TaxID=2787717 RepID=UPI0018C97D9D
MSLRFYDTATAQIRDFVPVKPGEVGLYYCGATVQGMPHVGHIRSAIAFDQLTRWLSASGYRVTTVRNVTDIDDKILARAKESEHDDGLPPQLRGEQWWALAYRYELEFQRAYDALGVRRPTYEPRATGHIPEMHALIQLLIDRGHAYPANDDSGDVYFDVRSWKGYGSLTRQNIDDMQSAADVEPQFSDRKRDPRDFALWKGWKEGEPETAAWPSPWGPGRPGWHLECSAMVTRYLGAEFDIHGGGLDLRFPHHENEMAQSQAAGHPFARYWMHNGMVTFEGEKMSKSIGNTVSPADMLNLASPRVVRYYLGQAHYRSVLDYRPTSLQEAAAAVERIDGFVAKAAAREFPNGYGFVAGPAPQAFVDAMNDDLNVPQALAVLHDTVRAGNSALAAGDSDATRNAFIDVMKMTMVLGLDDVQDPRGGPRSPEQVALNALIASQLEQRTIARETRDWAQADAIRDALASAGILIEDTADGASWSLKK